jgi:hypothetical protein
MYHILAKIYQEMAPTLINSRDGVEESTKLTRLICNYWMLKRKTPVILHISINFLIVFFSNKHKNKKYAHTVHVQCTLNFLVLLVK